MKTTTKKSEKQSPAYTLVKHVWDNSCEEVRHSWRTINASMHAALTLAITAGLTFAPDDFGKICEGMRSEYWFGLWANSLGEGFYVSACESGNLSACKAFEAWKGRPAFIFGGKRLHLSSEIGWGNEPGYFKVTSFAADGKSIVACKYKQEEDSDRTGRVEHTIDKRMTITFDELRAAEKKNRVSNADRCEVAKITRKLAWEQIEIDENTIRGWDKSQRKEALTFLTSSRFSARVRPAFFPKSDER